MCVFVYSGGQVGGPCPLQDAWMLGAEDGEWESLSSCAFPVVRSSMIAVSQLLHTREAQLYWELR